MALIAGVAEGGGVTVDTGVAVGAMLVGAATTNSLVGTGVGLVEGGAIASLAWQPADIDTTAITTTIHRDIA